ncbi:anoctamin-6 isoform X1 [Danio rerio]|uniref:Anoctamin n=2 Tax=Danio rerio TaxID=7955 RepID=F1QNZ8_DANRE|nr:anoctamin-6 isoform X1 [Danio rerio]|eukprot:XP_005164519.1 anoctamin-6 isoform X1 [Danio rerio]
MSETEDNDILEDSDTDGGDVEMADMIDSKTVQTCRTMPKGSDVPIVDFNGNQDFLFFNDGKRRIDFVLVYEYEESKNGSNKKASVIRRKKRRREFFEGSLMNKGLHLEMTQSVVDEKLFFVKLHMPFDVLCANAEVLHIKLPIKCNDLRTQSSKHNCCTKPFYPNEDVIGKEPDYFTAPFRKDLLNRFQLKEREGRELFTPTMRSRMVYYILSRAEYDIKGENKKFGITKLLAGGIYKAAYPLHDCRFNVKSKEEDCPNERYLLYSEWAHPKNFYKMQPLDLIRKYFGEKIGIYFAWLGFYTFMLSLAAAFGLGCFIYGYRSRESSTWSKEVCDPDIGGQIVMCPQCDNNCPYWRLNTTCESSKRLCVFDNFGTLVFAVFMSVWVTLFLEFWKRYQAKLEYKWDTVEFQQQEEQPRPEYEARCTYERFSPITQSNEKVPYTACGKCMRVSCGIGTVLFWILLIVASVVGVIVYRLAMFMVFSMQLRSDLNRKELEPFREYITPQMATSITASIINVIIIMILNIVYEKVAVWITDFELPRTKTEYENSLTLKMFLFQFVNFYSSCFYIAFFKGKIVGYPGEPVYWLGKFRNEECDPGGCLTELTTQLSIIMTGKAVWNNIQEVLLPWLKNLMFRHCTQVGSEKAIPRWEQDYQLQPMGTLGLFYEYLEMVIQFGFVTLFVASFPLAPLLALVNNLFEIRVDAWKFTTQFRRIVPEKAQDIGAWQPILQGVTILAVVTNTAIIAFTSDMIPRLVYYWAFSVSPYVENSNHTMAGFIDSSLSVFNISHFDDKTRPRDDIKPIWFNNITTCRYRDYRNPPDHQNPYQFNVYYWHVIAAKLAFMIVVEHIVYFTKFMLSYLIPDVPEALNEQIKRERFLTRDILNNSQLTDLIKPIREKLQTDVADFTELEELL